MYNLDTRYALSDPDSPMQSMPEALSGILSISGFSDIFLDFDSQKK
jgi:hypothetical protein